MAAYAALVSLMHTIEQIQHHPHPPISLDKEQVESLTEKLTFFQDFLEGYSFGGTKEVSDGLERRIADAAHTAEDLIESQIVELIRDEDRIRSVYFYQSLQKVMGDMDLIKKEVIGMREKDQVQRRSMPADSSRSCPTGKNFMVSFDDVLNEILDKLTGGKLNRQIIPIFGMGGIGKTTIARNIYINPLIEQYFDICAWVTISQEYSVCEILREVLGQVKGRGDCHETNVNELGEKLYKHLIGRRYLIVMDDMWSIEAWDGIKFFFSDNGNGSRIVVTTRLSNLASRLTGSSYSLEMKLLDEVKSWNLFCKTVFEEEGCPPELEEIGKKIAKNCKGLPLSIVVVGGLLAKSRHTRGYWKYIGENLHSVLNLEDNERCLSILYLSYNQLPVHLKPCFLYMGIFPEDHAIRVSDLIKLWVAEGFLKPISGKSLEEVAKEYFKDLVDRNLILVHQLGSTGNIKCCKIHDLLRDLCLREAHRDGFYDVAKQPSLNIRQGICTRPRIVIPQSIRKEKVPVRTLIWDSKMVLSSLDLKLLRIFKPYENKLDYHFPKDMFLLVNLRYVAFRAHMHSTFTSSISFLWNLHTIIVDCNWGTLTAPVEIWNMSQLRHVEFRSLYLPDPPTQNGVVLHNLQMLGTIINFNCSEELAKIIPNIKKLKTVFSTFYGYWSPCRVNSYDCLQKLESLLCRLEKETDLSHNFPHSLKKLSLEGFGIYWVDILEKIGSLPFLEKLRLKRGSFRGQVWETVEGQFCSLKFLKIEFCDLENWTTESTHFPCLKHLVLNGLKDLKEIPSDVGEIPTLESIHLGYCCDSVVISAKTILEKQEELEEVGFQVRVRAFEKSETLESLVSRNFQIEYGVRSDSTEGYHNS